MTMPNMRYIVIPALVLLACAAPARAISTAADAVDIEIAAAEAAEQQAAALKNRWTTTEQALAAAKKAAAAGDFDTAVKQAHLAEALAKASIAQANEQKDAWKAAVVR